MIADLKSQLMQILPEERILADEPMSRHCSFRTGGPADLFLRIRTADELCSVLALLKTAGEPFTVLGRGTNLLVADGGYRGAVVTMTGSGARPVTDTLDEEAEETDGRPSDKVLQRLDTVTVDGVRISAGAGASLSHIAAAARDNALAGMEFAAGIPGSAGGGLVMNAGAYDGEMRGIVETAQLLMPDGTLRTFSNEEMEFGYRRSILKRVPATAVSVCFVLHKGDRAEIAARMAELAEKRRARQPLEYASAGSTFKRPEGHFAGRLIMDAGLAGWHIGDAAVSEKHCGFVVNKGHATSDEVRRVIEHVQETVFAQSGIRLEREVIYLGSF
ncbi:MAG: UDP-N-acetylmuramate dehydrogenase [Lachnospiraceae bacterium]|jgi:UDP-N-acetylmuramate dehydrogenase|nr:UDP-N-acetylmuramate dehydrogenase [Lachnospiraceae bacterium]